jgi:hypothetical protein
MTSVWDDPELRAGGEFVKLENKGDRISGVINAIRSHRFEDGSVVPQVLFTDDTTGEERTWTAGQIQAKRKLAELRPEAGDWFAAELVDVEKRAGGKTLKHINVEVNRGGAPRQAAAAPPRPAPTAQTGDLAAVLAALSPDEKAKLLAQHAGSTAPPF